MEWKYLIASIVFSITGIVILALAFWIFERTTPGTLWREIIEEHNVALAIIAAAFMISMAIIIGSAVQS